MRYEDVKFSDLLGKTLNSILVNDNQDEIIFNTSQGEVYKLYHQQDCCESVDINDVNGDLNDLLNTPITQAEESSNSEDEKPSEWSESWTWTFYKLATIKGYVTIRWIGESNGYYSEGVDFIKVLDNE
jgi:hypothetical protein